MIKSAKATKLKIAPIKIIFLLFFMPEIKPLTLVSGCNLGVLISEHPEVPHKPHLLRCGKLKDFLILTLFYIQVEILFFKPNSSLLIKMFKHQPPTD